MNILEKLQQLADASGPKVQEMDITIGETTHKLLFRRLGLVEKQKLDNLLWDFNPETNKPEFSKDKIVDKNILLLAKSFVDESGKPVLTVEMIKSPDFDPVVGEKLIAAALEANGMKVESKEDIAKKSGTTLSEDS